MIFQESGITFNNVKKIGTKISAFPVGNPDNYEYEGDSLSRKDTEHIEEKGGFVNAIDIDWDGVQVNTIQPDCGIQTLNTTSDLLRWIKCLEYRISVLEGSGPITPDIDYYIIEWDDNGATTAHYGGSNSVYPGETVVLPIDNPLRRYAIDWNGNGATINASGGSNYMEYQFANWWTALIGGNQVTSSTIPTHNTTYYAHWNPKSITLPTTNPVRSYGITWNANGGSILGTGSQSVSYTFNNWWTATSGGTQVTTSTAITTNSTFYAHWISPSSIILPTAKRSGYDFMGWATTSGATVANVTANTIPTNTVTYYAVWQEQNAVLSSIRWTNATASSVEGESINLPTITLVYSDNSTNTISASFATLKKNGSSFELTTDTPAGTYNNITATYNELTTTNTLTYTITARPVTEYTVEFIDRGNILDSTTGPTGTQVNIPSVTPRNGYTFIGWNRTQNAGTDENVITTIGTQNITYYAQWGTITINLNPSTNQVITEPITVTSTVTNGVSANTNWTITNEGASGQTFAKSTSTGASVVITPNDMTAPTADTGTVSMTTGSQSQSTSGGTIALNGSFTPGQSNTKEYTTTLTASYIGVTPKSIDITFRKTTNPLSAGTYSWTVVGTLPSGVQLSSNTGPFVSLINTNSSPVQIAANTIKVTNANATNEAYNTEIITVPGKSETNTYYWYVGPTDPSTMTSISPIVNNNDMSSPGWREIGTTLPTYSSSNMLWNGVTNNISFGGRTDYYIALPNNSLQLWNGLGTSEMDGCTSLGTKVINNITYYVYKRNVKAAAFGFNIY